MVHIGYFYPPPPVQDRVKSTLEVEMVSTLLMYAMVFAILRFFGSGAIILFSQITDFVHNGTYFTQKR